jgi:transposase
MKKKTTIQIFDFSTIYTTIPRNDITEILQMLALNINKPITTIPHEQFNNPFKRNH